MLVLLKYGYFESVLFSTPYIYADTAFTLFLARNALWLKYSDNQGLLLITRTICHKTLKNKITTLLTTTSAYGETTAYYFHSRRIFCFFSYRDVRETHTAHAHTPEVHCKWSVVYVAIDKYRRLLLHGQYSTTQHSKGPNHYNTVTQLSTVWCTRTEAGCSRVLDLLTFPSVPVRVSFILLLPGQNMARHTTGN